MLRTLDPERDHLIEQAVTGARNGGLVGVLLAHYLQHVPGEDLRARTPADLAALLEAHGDLASERPRGTTNVRVLGPEAGPWTAGREVVQIVTDDMPFLVDSVTAELARHRRDIHLLIHPQVVVRRDDSGHLLEVLSTASPVRRGEEPPEGAVVESWIHVDIDPEPSVDRRPYPDLDPDPGLGGREGLLRGLARVLDDVRAAVTDWPRMRGTAMALAAELAAEESDRGPALRVHTDQAIELLRWLADDHFTFLAYAEYHRDAEGELSADPDSALGVRHMAEPRAEIRPVPDGEPLLTLITKADARSTVHRRAYLDQIGLAVHDEAGNVVGERRFLGLFAASAYTDSVRHIPVVADKVEAVLERAGFDAESHSGKDLLEILETYPRDELFEVGVGELTETAVAVMHLQERRRTRLFVRRDVYGRYASCLVYLPRDRYTTEVRQRITDVLDHAFGGTATEFSARVSESVLARLHLVVRVAPGTELGDLDVDAVARVEEQLAAVTRTWEEELEDELRLAFGDVRGGELARRYAGAFPEAYKEDVEARRAVDDVERLDGLDPLNPTATGLRLILTGGPTHRFTLYRNATVTLSAVLPFLADLGADVVDERPYHLNRRDGTTAYVYDFGLRSTGDGVPSGPEAERAADLFCDAFAAAWSGEAESDGFAKLVLLAGLDWRQVSVLRAYAKYLRLTGTTFSQIYLEECLCTHAPISRRLVRLFEARFAPDLFRDGRLEVAEALEEEIREALDDVVSLDHDRILRSYLALVHATLRTNYFAERRFDDVLPTLAFKLAPRSLADLPGMPQPLPSAEIFVYSPRVEGVHLRFGAVARGGLRWSDRREDFRTEVLGLVKAQTVKNAVIVPTGAKGGFVPKRLPDPAVDRDAWLAEGVACYRAFVGALLDVTDNLKSAVGGHGTIVVPPTRVVRHDEDDPYLVVAADKGTAAFSDIANALAARYGFWLGDAFASGGSVGYDHKAMGITARGAWESVKWHFRELGVDVQREEITVVGVGDMSGDVFGNGMLLSPHLRVVAAFDHRHVFLDPDPVAAVSFSERQRLFSLPRSSWADYDETLISAGGGVFPRSAKSVPITPQVAERLGLTRRGGVAPTALTPAELIKAILRAPVDLLWNGGIGTYVKASSESHLDAGDKASDAVRIDGHQLRVRVVGEGGNLGLTQRGRIEASLAGVRLNTDAIDNSAGVDCSDHEVNIKILLDQVVASGDLTPEGRSDLLRDMTNEVAALVLRDNYEQNQLLASGRAGARGMVPVHQRFMRSLEARGALDRALEFLPTDVELSARSDEGQGLTSPELSVLAAYAKITVGDDLLATGLPDDAWLERVMRGYFPTPLVLRYSDRLPAHPLRREIATNVLVNDMVNLGGATFVFRAQEETGADAEQVARAFVVVREIFGLNAMVTQIEQLDGTVPTSEQAALLLLVRRLLDRAVRWFLRHRPGGIELAGEIDRFAGTLERLIPHLPSLLVGSERQVIKDDRSKLVERGLPEPLAERVAALLDSFVLLDITEIAGRVGGVADDVARLYLRLTDRYAVDELLVRVAGLPRRDRWQALARAALRNEIYSAIEAITLAVLRSTTPDTGPAERIEVWERDRKAAIERASRTLGDIARLDEAELAPLSVAAATLRSIAVAGE